MGQEKPGPHRCEMLLARINDQRISLWDEALPLSCPTGDGQMRIIVSINEAASVKKILDHIGEAIQPPRTAPARGSPL